jgi:hypothetical protein
LAEPLVGDRIGEDDGASVLVEFDRPIGPIRTAAQLEDLDDESLQRQPGIRRGLGRLEPWPAARPLSEIGACRGNTSLREVAI